MYALHQRITNQQIQYYTYIRFLNSFFCQAFLNKSQYLYGKHTHDSEIITTTKKNAAHESFRASKKTNTNSAYGEIVRFTAYLCKQQINTYSMSMWHSITPCSWIYRDANQPKYWSESYIHARTQITEECVELCEFRRFFCFVLFFWVLNFKWSE